MIKTYTVGVFPKNPFPLPVTRENPVMTLASGIAIATLMALGNQLIHQSGSDEESPRPVQETPSKQTLSEERSSLGSLSCDSFMSQSNASMASIPEEADIELIDENLDRYSRSSSCNSVNNRPIRYSPTPPSIAEVFTSQAENQEWRDDWSDDMDRLSQATGPDREWEQVKDQGSNEQKMTLATTIHAITKWLQTIFPRQNEED